MEKKNNLFISYTKEIIDSQILIDKIVESKWVLSGITHTDMVIVNCFPEYSSRVSQFANHKLSYLNGDKLFEQIDLAMPFPDMAQVWNPCDRRYQGFYNYMSDWVRANIFSTNSYLFISSKANLSEIRPFLKVKLESFDYRFASVYVKQGDWEPDFWVEKYSKPPLFEWENTNK